MRIDSHTPAPIKPEVATVVNSTASPERAAAKATEDSRFVPSTKFAPTGDLAKLLAAVKQTPDVRTDVVEEVSNRIAAGELSTPAAAHAAATVLYDSLNS